MDAHQEQAILDLWDTYAEDYRYVDEDGEWHRTDQLLERRSERLPHLQSLVDEFRSGELSIEEFWKEIDRENKKHKLWGFGGFSGQMFFNILVTRSEDLERTNQLVNSLRALIEPPENPDDAASKIGELADFVRSLKDELEDQQPPAVGHVPMFLSYFWHLQEDDHVPIFYAETRNALQELDLWEPSGPVANQYAAFWRVMEDCQQVIINERDTSVTPTELDLAFLRYLYEDADQPDVFQVPISKDETTPIRRNFETTVLDDVPTEAIEEFVPLEFDRATVRVWGNDSSVRASPGDVLLFGDRGSDTYDVMASVLEAAELSDEAASAFADAVDWEHDDPFHHVIFLDEVYEANLPSAKFWSLLGYQGFPHDTFSRVNFRLDESSFFDTHDSVTDFLDEIRGTQLYPRSGPKPPVEEYESVSEAMEDIFDRVRVVDDVDNWLDEALTTTILADWTEHMKNIAVQNEVSRARAVRLEQIQSLFERAKPRLQEQADALGSGTLGRLDNAETLFMAFLRDLQRQHDIGSQPNANQAKLKTILHGKYTVEGGEPEPPGRPDHPLLTKLADDRETVSVYKFTAPPDDWIVSLEYRAVEFGDAHENRWESLDEGDLLIFHSQAETSAPDVEDQQGVVFGAGIVGKRYEKDDQWWWKEFNGDASYPYVAGFERLYVTSELEQIDLATAIDDKDPEQRTAEVEALVANGLSLEVVNDLCEDATGTGFPAQGSMASLEVDSGDADLQRATAIVEAMVDDLTEVPPINHEKAFDGDLPTDVLDGLYFPDNRGREILDQITAALRAGDHVILTGPPGTGKTEIADRVADHVAETYPYLYTGSQLTTATADWSTFDTVGGYMPNEETDDDADLSFTPGIVLNRLKDRHSGTQANEPIVIDELNRADIDKGFGQLFTLLSGQSVQLPFTKDGHEVELLTTEQLEGLPRRHQYLVPDSWRIFATMNTYDKTSLYEMSYAFMRRFAFIRVPAPDFSGIDTADDSDALLALMNNYVAAWDGLDATEDELLAVGRVWQHTNQAVEERSIGPAIVRDMLGYVTRHERDDSLSTPLTEAVISYIFPQLEGVPERTQIVKNIRRVESVDDDELEESARDMLQITFDESES